MKKIIAAIILLCFFASCKVTAKITTSQPPVTGNFTDDYGISYSISDSLWVQHPNIKYHIIKWNKREQYLIARNDGNNPSEAGLYTRIDYMFFQNMGPFLWGFCLTVYNAKQRRKQ